MKEKLQNFTLTLRRYWQRPKKGDSVAYKEIAGFSVGGMGVKSFGSLLGNYIQLTPLCLLMSAVYSLSPRDIMWLFIITNIIGVVKTPFVSMLVDNTNTAIGKFRPYIVWAGIPSLIAVIGLSWFVPLDASPIIKMILIGIFVNLLNIAQPLLNNAYIGISQVISPNSQERTKIMGISEFFANLGPSIVQFLLPTLGMLFFGATALENIWTYRIFMPLFGLISFFMGLIIIYTTQERVLLPKGHVNKIGFIRGIKHLCKNKEFLLVTFSKFFDGFKGVLTLLLGWVCAYQLGNSGMTGIMQTITSLGFTPGIIIAPILISKFGSKKSGIITHLFNCVAGFVMLFTFKQGFAFFIISLFLYNFALGPQYIIQNTILSDGFDAQQDRQNIRIEGFAQNFQLMVTTLGGIVSTVVFTAIYEMNGLVANAETGLTDYTILRDAAVREPIITTVIIVVIAASLLAAIPYFFCSLDRKKMKIIRESLERKKFITENELQNATEEAVNEAYASYLLLKEAQDAKNHALDEKEKALLAAKQEKEKAEKEAFEQGLAALAEEMKRENRSEKEIRRAIKERKKLRADEKRKQRKAAFEKIRDDQKSIRERKKQFCADWIEEAKKEGKKRYLRVLAKEAFSRLLAEEAAKSDDESYAELSENKETAEE